MAKDIPIIFSAPMVRALLDGRKTMTRRLARTSRKTKEESGKGFYRSTTKITASPWCRVKPGDRLWVRENIRLISAGPGRTVGLNYAADGEMGEVHFFKPEKHKLKRIGITPCIHMPRWASRLSLTVTAIKTERLHDISAEDAISEGCKVVREHCYVFDGTGYDTAKLCHSSPVTAFSCLWSELHGNESWEDNPEVVALTFTIDKQNIDALQRAA